VAKKQGPPKTNAARILDDLGVGYEIKVVRPDPSDLSAETAARLLDAPMEIVYKTILLRGPEPSSLFEVCLPAGREVDLKAMARAAGCRSASLVPLKDLFPLTGYHRGGCSPLGGRHRYPVYIHREALLREKIYINAGQVGVMLLLAPGDLVRAAGAVPADVARPPGPAGD
jgi:Cys-tRNA(Pro)/Cys-tRNA(Cys) deacylase